MVSPRHDLQGAENMGASTKMKRTVLIVDEDAQEASRLEAQLASSGYDVALASDGDAGLKIMYDAGAPLVIADWGTERVGVEFCEAIKSFEGFGFVYTIILTSDSSEDRLVEAFEAGADDFLTKPVNMREMVARLRAGERIVNLERDLAQKAREIVRYNAEMEVANRQLEEAIDQLNRMVTTDALTRLRNRRAAIVDLENYWSIASATHAPLSCIALDIDHFKRFNDEYGHAIGDLVLVETAKTLSDCARGTDLVYRIGGEEFLIICPQSRADMAVQAAERHRARIEAMELNHEGKPLKVTVSLGVAQRTGEMTKIDHLLKAADDALYQSKRGGRNCVTIHGRTPTDSLRKAG